MDFILSILTTREIALSFWLLLTIVLFSLNKPSRTAMRSLLGDFFITGIQLSILALAIYMTIITLGLSLLGLWTQALLKDTIVWGVTVAFVMQMSVNKIRSKDYFKNVIRDTLKWTIFLEFVLSLYTFNLLTELILISSFVVLGALQGIAMTDKKHQKVQNLLSGLTGIIGLTIISITIYKTVDNYTGVLTINSLISFVYPIIMTLFFIPFIYCYAVYVKYDTLFSLASHFAKDKTKVGNIKKQILWTAKLNLWTLWIIHFNLHKIDFTRDNLDGMIKEIVKWKPAANKSFYE